MSGLPESLHNLALDRRMTCARHSQARPNTEQTASARERRPNIAMGLRSSASVAESKGGLPIVEFADQTAWEDWLQRNHQCQDGVWMKLAKKAAPVKTQTHAEALEAALCYGWIDGQAARYDDHYMLMRFTPRRRRSKWSQINREWAQQLIAQGKMKPAGLAAVQAAKTDGRWDAAYPAQSAAPVPDDLRRALDENPRAKAFFATLTGSTRYAFLYRLHHVTDAEKRAHRIAEYLRLLSERRTLS
jgi:uncharacterized protein YdeI (YjbR/CyaY-like superfamily)